MTQKLRRQHRWIALIAMVILLSIALVAWHFLSSRHLQPYQHLAHVVQVEQDGIDETNAQLLGWALAILGRDDEVRALDFHPQFELPPLVIDPAQLQLTTIPWREGIAQIAAEHRIVMIMESHFVSKHREFIDATLRTFKDHRFTHYAAEAIGESGTKLGKRGFPTYQSGYYTCDPTFGNAIRSALKLDLHVLGYDFRPFSHETREDYAATHLAKVFNEGAANKMLVHAGSAHVLKHETEAGDRWLASRLWEKTGVEPFTIWQWSELHDAHEYRVVAEVLAASGEFDEPVLLLPPPSSDSGLRDVPRVDAIVVHPPDMSVAPDQRTPLFPGSARQIAGQWRDPVWPVVICAYAEGEPAFAVPLDQVMLRKSETQFQLAIPQDTPFVIRVFDLNGLRNAVSRDDNGVVVVSGTKTVTQQGYKRAPK